MDRLPALILPALVLAAACQEPKPRETLERVNAVAADPAPAAKVAAFCDVMPAADKPRAFRYPELAGPAPGAEHGARWINVWATWCKPCIEELPLLLRWQEQLAKAGAAFELVLLSLDEDDDTIRSFRKQHPEMPPSLRIKHPAHADRWAATLGLDRGAAIPIHVFVDPRGRVRCARTGSVGRDHLPAVQALLTRPDTM
jgi:thiol-disulfide isomerase/thioredoxin